MSEAHFAVLQFLPTFSLWFLGGLVHLFADLCTASVCHCARITSDCRYVVDLVEYVQLRGPETSQLLQFIVLIFHKPIPNPEPWN